MPMRTRVSTALLVLALLLVSVLVATPVLAQAPGTLDVYQDSVCDGGSVLITGSGWPGSTFVHLRFDGTPLWGTFSGSGGNIATWRTLPDGRTPNTTYFVSAYVPQEPAVEEIVFEGVLILGC